MIDFLTFWLKKLNPFRFLMAPVDKASSLFTENMRSRGLLLGLPAAGLAVLLLVALGWTEFREEGELESRYDLMAGLASKEKIRLTNLLKTEANERANSLNNEEADLEQTRQRVAQIQKLIDTEELYLQKLISLDPDDPDYRFRLAVSWLQQGSQNKNKAQVQRGMALINTIAPVEEPGYSKAHLFIAQFLLAQQSESARELTSYRRLALKHAEHCLVRDQNNRPAMIMKAQLYLTLDQPRWEDAAVIYNKLFDEDPQFYKQILNINQRLGRSEVANRNVLESATDRFLQMTERVAKDDNQRWTFAWTNYVECMVRAGDYVGIEQKLLAEESRQAKISYESPSFEASARLAEIKKLLTFIYAKWAGATDVDADGGEQRRLDLLVKALTYDKRYPEALRLVSRIATSDSELADEAKLIYDPTQDDNAPATVYNDLGSLAMVDEDYDKAVDYFELARRKRPNDPLILNNLAYAYLVREDKDPDLALDLVNRAIRSIAGMADPKERQLLASYFYDTRGRALMQMDRTGEAAAAFEMALRIRPKKKEILEALVKCYEGSDDLQAEVYRRRIEELEQEEGGSAAD